MIYQEEQDIQEKQPENASFATISQVFEDGVTLRFGQEDTPVKKDTASIALPFSTRGTECFWRKTAVLMWCCFPLANQSRVFGRTQRRRRTLPPRHRGQLWHPMQRARLRRMRRAGRIRQDRLTSARTIALTGDVSASGSFSGGANLSLSATSAKTAAVKDQSSPSSRTIRFRVAAAGKLQFQSSYYNNSTWYNMDGTQA